MDIYIYHLQVAKFVFKSINYITPLNFHDWFKLNHELHALKTRANFNIAENTTIKNLFIPMVRTTNYGLKQLKANGPRIWNSLPTNIKNATTLLTFTKSLKVHYSSHYG